LGTLVGVGVGLLSPDLPPSSSSSAREINREVFLKARACVRNRNSYTLKAMLGLGRLTYFDNRMIDRESGSNFCSTCPCPKAN